MRVFASDSWIFTGLSIVFLLGAFYLSVVRRPTRRARVTFLVMCGFLAAVSFWPKPPELRGWIVVAFTVGLAAASAILLMRPRSLESSEGMP